MRMLVCSLAALVIAALGGVPVAGAAETRVEIVDADPDTQKWGYEPATVTVTAGSSVLWRNAGQQPHTVTADDGSFKSEYLSHGGEFRFTFPEPGEFTYFCEPHRWMKATVSVMPGSSPPPPPPVPATPTTAAAPPATAAPAPPPPARATTAPRPKRAA
ncbi:MAG: cupredoxin domain-containing protein, partial [Acidimicrobiia bacterium]